MDISQRPVHPVLPTDRYSSGEPILPLSKSPAMSSTTRKHSTTGPTSTVSMTSSTSTVTTRLTTPKPSNRSDLQKSTSHHPINTITLSKPLFISVVAISGTLFILALLIFLYLSYRSLKARRARRSAEQWGRQTRFWGARTEFLDNHQHQPLQQQQTIPNEKEHIISPVSPMSPQQHLQRQPTKPNLKPLPHDPPSQPSHRRVSAMSKAIDDAFRARYMGVFIPSIPEYPEMAEVDAIESAVEVWGDRRLDGPGVFEVPNVPAGARERALEEYARLARVGQIVRCDDLREMPFVDGRQRGRVMSLFFDQGVGFWIAKR